MPGYEDDHGAWCSTMDQGVGADMGAVVRWLLIAAWKWRHRNG